MNSGKISMKGPISWIVSEMSLTKKDVESKTFKNSNIFIQIKSIMMATIILLFSVVGQSTSNIANIVKIRLIVCMKMSVMLRDYRKYSPMLLFKCES